MSLLCASEPLPSNAAARSCDHLAHAYGNAVGHRDRERRYPSDMSEAEWAAVRPLLPVPAWLRGRGGSPEGHCHRQLQDVIRHLVTGGISWRAMPADFPGFLWNQRCQVGGVGAVSGIGLDRARVCL
ncbi:transposase [Streptomyces sp. NPDC002763]|uniref:transposase n=1 Tax=Streptomyces sp. NPDC002763 TaxID=3154427 RepID=UPI00331AB201